MNWLTDYCRIKSLSMSISRKEATEKAMKLCSTQEKCRQDIRIKLKSWAYFGDDVEDLIGTLVKEKFIDEVRYASFFSNDKFKFNKWGKTKIRYELSLKQIPDSIISTALDNIDENEYYKTLKDLINNKSKSVKSKSQFEKNSKLIRFAQGKGFEYEIIKDILNDI